MIERQNSSKFIIPTCLAILAILSLIVVGCGDTKESDSNAPSAAQLFNKAASAAKQQKTMFTSGKFDGSIELDAGNMKTDGEKSASGEFTLTQSTDSNKAEMTFADYKLYVDNQDVYLTTPDKSFKLSAANNPAASSVPVNQLTEYQDMLIPITKTFASATTVTKGEPIDKQATWAVKINFEDIDYRKVVKQYFKLIVKASTDQPGISAAEKKMINKTFSQADQQMSDEELDKIKQLLSELDYTLFFSQKSGLLSGVNFSVDWGSKELETMLGQDAGSSKIDFDLTTTFSWSTTPFTVNPPKNAIDLNTPNGQQQFFQSVQGLSSFFSN